MQTRQLGSFRVSAIGLGAMPISMNNDKSYPEESQAIATIHAALDSGITLIDTADIYAPTWDSMGHNEKIVGKAVASYGGNTDDVVIATKGGITNANVEEIQIAIDVLGEDGLVSVQNEFSPKFRCSEKELDLCAERGIAFLPWSPLGGTGGGARDVGDRFAVFAEIGRDHGVSPQQVVLAWELSLDECVIPIPGARRPESISDSAKAADLKLSADELERCSATGGRRGPGPRTAVCSFSGGGATGLLA